MWTLLLARAADPPGACIDRRQIDSGQIKIGRGARQCDWVLADEQGTLSREHCTIIANGLDLFVVDNSTNGVSLNSAAGRIQPQLPVAIRMGDKLFLGDYRIEIANEATAAAAVVAPPPSALPLGRSAPPASGVEDDWFKSEADPIWGRGPQHDEVHEFLGNSIHDFLGTSPKGGDALDGSFGDRRGADAAFGGTGMGAAFNKPIMAPMGEMPADFGIPENWANLDSRSASSAEAQPDPFKASVPSRPDPFAGPTSDPVADPFADPFARPSSDESAIETDLSDSDPFGMPIVRGADPFADFDLPSPAPASASAPLVAGPTPTTPLPMAAQALSSGSGDVDWAAFAEGAGIDLADLRLAPDSMRRLGVFYRQIVLGLSDLIQERAEFKQEFRVERTQLGIGRNNPLKHLPPLDSAKLMLADPLPGFMASDEAVRTAFEDLKKHQLAMLAGVQAAMTAVFQRLAPEEIEKLMRKAAGERKGLLLKRGVDPWTVYQTVFEALRMDATSNANSVMSVAFRDGYETFLKSGPGADD